ncbi:MAG: TetR/AcrR family transcriptional regulator [Sphingomonadales bacterium]|nr:MAG: TetR/AcrR family transcriptional regulator [Sphingomonadales bacterium]
MTWTGYRSTIAWMKAEDSGHPMTVKRRMGPVGSPSWHMLLDAAEDILREEGYAALTSRNITSRAGVNQQLLYYYFHTMEELIVAAFRRAAGREMERLEAAAESDHPLQAIWKVRSKKDLRSMPEFAALANRIEDLRAEIVDFRKNVRQLQVAALHKSLAGREAPTLELPAPALIALLDYAALYVNRDSEFDVVEGQRELITAFETFLDGIEPEATNEG